MLKFHKLPPHLTFFSPTALIATFCGSGLLRPASGTWGSLAALMVGLPLACHGGAELLLMGAAIAYAAGYWATRIWLSGSDDKDPSPIVIDEVVGQWVVLAAVPLTPLGVAAAFLLFRLFDIIKPWPASWADKKLSGAHGVMLDDVFASIWAAVVLLAAQHYKLL